MQLRSVFFSAAVRRTKENKYQKIPQKPLTNALQVLYAFVRRQADKTYKYQKIPKKPLTNAFSCDIILKLY